MLSQHTAITTGTILTDSVSYNLESIRFESKQIFYSTLGSLLANIHKLDRVAASKVCSILLNQCLRHGPTGADAGVFVASLGYGDLVEFDRDAHAAYVQRLENSRSLRNALFPLIYELANAGTSNQS